MVHIFHLCTVKLEVCFRQNWCGLLQSLFYTTPSLCFRLSCISINTSLKPPQRSRTSGSSMAYSSIASKRCSSLKWRSSTSLRTLQPSSTTLAASASAMAPRATISTPSSKFRTTPTHSLSSAPSLSLTRTPFPSGACLSPPQSPSAPRLSTNAPNAASPSVHCLISSSPRRNFRVCLREVCRIVNLRPRATNPLSSPS